MTAAMGDASAQQARRRVEQAIRRARPASTVGKVALTIAAPVAGALAEQAVKTLEERGPEMASKGVELLKLKVPVVAEKAATRAKALRAVIRERRNRGGTAADGPDTSQR